MRVECKAIRGGYLHARPSMHKLLLVCAACMPPACTYANSAEAHTLHALGRGQPLHPPASNALARRAAGIAASIVASSPTSGETAHQHITGQAVGGQKQPCGSGQKEVLKSDDDEAAAEASLSMSA